MTLLGQKTESYDTQLTSPGAWARLPFGEVIIEKLFIHQLERLHLESNVTCEDSDKSLPNHDFENLVTTSRRSLRKLCMPCDRGRTRFNRIDGLPAWSGGPAGAVKRAQKLRTQFF